MVKAKVNSFYLLDRDHSYDTPFMQIFQSPYFLLYTLAWVFSLPSISFRLLLTEHYPIDSKPQWSSQR